MSYDYEKLSAEAFMITKILRFKHELFLSVRGKGGGGGGGGAYFGLTRKCNPKLRSVENLHGTNY